MKFKPTKAQELAINTDGGLLVSAAAGSGKTAVLAERVIRLLTDKKRPIDADRMLIVTYTNAAAEEMRERIEKRLFEECRKHPQDTALIRQRRLISSAKICTIDSFCIDLVRENFEKCGVEPDFKVGDGSDLVSVDDGVMADIIHREIADNSSELKKLMEVLGCEYDETNLNAVIKEIFSYSMQQPSPDVYYDSLIRPFALPFDGNHPWKKTAFKIAENELLRAESLIVQLNDAIPYLEKGADKQQQFADILADLYKDLKTAVENRDWDTVCAVFRSAGLPNKPQLSTTDPAARDVRSSREELCNIIPRISDYFTDDTADIEAMQAELLPTLQYLITLVREYKDKLFEAYKQENSFTFYNTEQLALSLLCETKDGKIVSKSDSADIISRFDIVMVDEFQDVNDLQNLLFDTISDGGKNLFVVGDVKQSIYGFRGSNPKNFLDKKQSYDPYREGETAEKRKIVLSDNFRSCKGVCGFVNFFFSLFLQGQTGNIIYNEEERLNCSADLPESDTPSVKLLMVSPTEEEEDTLLQLEAEQTARYIKQTMAKDPFISDGDTVRKARYGDFAILLGTLKNKASVISDVLKSHGIPVLYNAETFKDTIEVNTVTSLLKIIDNPRCDIELLTVMMSPIFIFTADEIALIRSNSGKGSLYSAVTLAAKNGDLKSQSFIDRLFEMRRNAVVLPVDKLLSRIFDTTDYLNIVSAMPQGSVRRENLLTLLKLARQYCDNSKTGIYGFLKLLENMPDKETKSVGDENSVKIMSMHSSKGLQFPVCIISGTFTQFNRSDSISRFLKSETFGIGIKYTSETNGDEIDTLPHKIIARQAHINMVDERLRLLYVALTRAKQQLVIFSSNKDISQKLKNIAGKISGDREPITAEFLRSSLSMNDWLLAAALLHKSGDKLRLMSESAVLPIVSDTADFEICFTKNEDLEEQAQIGDKKTAELNAQIETAVMRNFGYEYPYRKLGEINSKMAVSEIAKNADDFDFAYTEKPFFAESSGISAADKGTAIHRIMQFIDMSEKTDVEAEIERLSGYGFISEKQAECADRNLIGKFFQSDVFSRILNAKEVHREMRFLTEIPASEFDASLPQTDAKAVIQGACDLCFVEDDGVVVLDFKTDRVKNEQRLIDAYSKQLDIYAAACEKIFSKPVKQKIIYSFALSKEITV